MSCPDDQTISAFADDELEAGQAAEVERHLAKCPTCRQLVEELQWVDDCGRAALGAIPVGQPTPANIVCLKPPRRKWTRPVSLAAAAAVVLAVPIWSWVASSRSNHHQTTSAPHQVESVKATSPGSNGELNESNEIAFEQWAAPYRELHTPLVPMEVAENYHSPAILPVLPADSERNH